ncbi:MAG TPA: putative Ig domain-containing protein [Acidimicrobiales bacterium]
MTGSKGVAVVVAALVACGVSSLPATATPHDVARTNAAAPPGPVTLSYTGTEQSYTVPSGVVLLSIQAIGAPGGGTGQSGAGFSLTAQVPVTPGEVLYTEVGEPGTSGGGPGFGGGGAAGATSAGPTNQNAGSGGGATDVRTCSEAAKSCAGGAASADTRLIVAGGGGGEGGQGSSVSTVCGFSESGGNAGAGNGSGGTVVTTAAGTVVLGSSDATSSPSTPAGGGTASSPGSGGPSTANCGTGTTSYIDSAGGSSGSTSQGGGGGTGVAGTGGGGGGGGGYFGGGGGASGPEGCIASTCDTFDSGEGGGGGSSFVSSLATLETATDGNASSPPSVTFTPRIEIDSPAAGATYTTGQTVDASWSCDTSQVSGCTGTTPSGSPVQTSPCGAYAYSVTGSIMGQSVAGTVHYAVAMDVTTTSLPDATTGLAYREQLEAACGASPYTWRRTSGSLPHGLKLKSTGLIAGVPYKNDAPGPYTFAVVAKDSTVPRHQTATKVFTLDLTS